VTRSRTPAVLPSPDAAPDSPPWAPWPTLDECLDKHGEPIERDADGDGVPGVWLVGCGGERQSGTELSNDDDCDDLDEARSRKGWADADGDGWTSGAVQCFATLPSGYRELRSPSADCDDTNPELQQIAYGDADGDGYGNLGDPRCALSPHGSVLLPAGLADNASDCNDDDPAIHPAAVERWDDSVDTDCDGVNDPLACTGTSGQCGCDLSAEAAIPIVPTCTSADLLFIDQRVCRSCRGYNAFVIGNRGTLPVQGGFDLVSPDGQKTHFEQDLAPGAVSHPLLVFGSAPSVRIVAAAEECDVTNNLHTLESPNGICDP
jgi:hypothetical protein